MSNAKANVPRKERVRSNGTSFIEYENQKTICILKFPKKEDGSLFTMMYNDDIDKAMGILSASAFKIWVYMRRNASNYEFALSRKVVTQVCNISSATYQRAVTELIEKGYLVQHGDTNYYYSVDDNEYCGLDFNEYKAICRGR